MNNDREPVLTINAGGITIGKPITTTTCATPYEDYVCGKNLFEPQKDKCAIGKTLPKKWVQNGPATILFWEDGTKTIVKCNQDDEFDGQKGYLMAYFEKWTGLSKHQIAKIMNEIE